MDELHCKLDQLLARSTGGGCPMCGICSQHSSQLSTQGELLESLDCKVAEVRAAVDELARGLEGRTCDQICVPSIALQRRKSLPVRTSVEEVYVQLNRLRDQKLIQHSLNESCGKAILVEDAEDEGMICEASSLKNDNSAVKDPDQIPSSKQAAKEFSPRIQASSIQSESKQLNLAKHEHNKPTEGTKEVDVAGTSTMSVSSKMKIIQPVITVPTPENTKCNSPPKMLTPSSEKVNPSLKTSTPLTEVSPPLDKVTPPQKVLTPPEKTLQSKDIQISAKSMMIPNQATAKITAVPGPVKVALYIPNTTTQTSVSTALESNKKLGVGSSPLVTSMSSSVTTTTTSTSSNPPKFNVTKFTVPSSHASPQSQTKRSPPNSIIPKSTPRVNGSLSSKPPSEAAAPAAQVSVPTDSISSNHKFPNVSSCDPKSQSFLKPPGISSAAKPIATKVSSLSPTNPSGLTSSKPSVAASFLKQVYSCPDSLQSHYRSGVKVESPRSAPPPPPPHLKPSTAPTGAMGPASLNAEGIQIKISPAMEPSPTQGKTSPKTCFKIIDDVAPQPAPFPHRCVTLKPSQPFDYSIHTREVLGGGRFGKVHKCSDNKNGLRLAAKIIGAKGGKEKEMAVNEIEAMNQLNHANILQLFDAFESKNQVVLILEYVEGGELFERIVDESCPLTEVDAMVFVKQICEGVQYMHHMYVLHLDLKPENILCVNRSSHQIKIIDFGLARRYKPREKLRVSFGTPEFLAPEVVNFDFVSFPTDMWTLGVVTYMLLSGLSPFLGDDDSETLNNVLTLNWYFDEETFEHVSAEAKDFISNLLIRERGGRLSAAQCLKHPWLNNISEKAKHSNIVLKSQILLRKYMARRLWKKNYIAIAAANRFKKISSSGSLTSLGV